RLTYALAQDGLLPSMFGRLHGRYRTPWANLLVQAVWALVFSTLFDLRSLLSTAVLFLSITYLLTALSAMRLVRRHPEQRLHLPAVQIWLSLAAAASVYLAAQGSPRQMAVAGGVLGGGCVLYLVRRRRPGMAVAPPGGMTVRAHHEPHGWLWRSWRRSRRPRADSRG
ncbi:MAG: amino acid permease, partial [Dehalococcoidia bacterium]|nr:amino acid permease [Dehalococcoidia bacterium]